MSFSDDAARVLARAGLAGAGVISRRPHTSAELGARRRAGREAYEQAMAARGVPVAQARIYASALPWLLGDDD